MSSWSFSAYSSAVQCLRKHKLCYIDKIAPRAPESGDLVFGSALHAAINEQLTGGNGAELFETYWLSYKDKEIDYGRYKWEELAQIGAGFIRKFTKSHAPKYKLIFAEERLYAEYKGIKLEGTPDFFGEYNGNTSLRDFKTSARNYEPAKSDCALQLYLYSYLYKQSKGVYPLLLGYTVFNKAIGSIQDLTWEFDERKMYEALDDLVDYCVSVDKRGTAPRNLNACLDYNRKCEYFDICHKGEKK